MMKDIVDTVSHRIQVSVWKGESPLGEVHGTGPDHMLSTFGKSGSCCPVCAIDTNHWFYRRTEDSYPLYVYSSRCWTLYTVVRERPTIIILMVEPRLLTMDPLGCRKFYAIHSCWAISCLSGNCPWIESVRKSVPSGWIKQQEGEEEN